jgi:DNA primase
MTGVVPGADFMKSLAVATHRYAQDLPGSPGEAYLEGRGITPQAMAYFKLGYVSNPLPEHAEYEGMLAIPYVTCNGIVTIRFRYIGTSGRSKYMSLHGIPGKARPFNVRAFQKVDPVIHVCEGEIDTITAAQCGLTAVGYPGANAWKSEHWRLFRFRHVVVLADNDDTGAGVGFANAVSGDIRDSKVILMPKGHDVNSFYVAEGRDALRAHVGA